MVLQFDSGLNQKFASKICFNKQLEQIMMIMTNTKIHRKKFRPWTQDEYKITDCGSKDKPWCTLGPSCGPHTGMLLHHKKSIYPSQFHGIPTSLLKKSKKKKVSNYNTHECDFTMHKSDFHPNSVISTHKSVISTHKSVILTLTNVITTRLSVILTRTRVRLTRMRVNMTITSVIMIRSSMISTRRM
jgi:hypothetical protein